MFRTLQRTPTLFLFASLCVSIFCPSVFVFAQQPVAPQAAAPAPGSPADLVQQGQKLSRDGRQDDALVLYQQALATSPNLYDAHLAIGIALDLKGDYSQAQEHFTKALDLAPADSKQQVLRAMAVSYVFAGDAFNAAKSELEVFNARMAKNDLIGGAEICNELARIYLELGDSDHAAKWYGMGYQTASHKEDLTDADKNLWLFRWESAQARVAARRGQSDEARQHVAAAKAALDKANNPDQQRFFPYLTGYVAFYTGDYKTAVADLQKADQHDPLILALLGEAFEKTGDATTAKTYYRKVLDVNFHNSNSALARPLAQKKLSGRA